MKYMFLFIVIPLLMLSKLKAQKIESEYHDLKDDIFANFNKPIGMAILKFEGSENFDIKLFDEFKSNQNFFNKFTPFTYEVLDKQKKFLRITSLDPYNPKVLRALKDLDINIIITGKIFNSDSVQLDILNTDGEKILSSIYKNSSNSNIIKDISRLFYDNKITIYKISTPPGMVLVEGGEFYMGDENGNEDEKPVHKVRIKSFYLDIYEVSQKEFENVMGYNPSINKNPDAPVENVTWFEANEYATKVGKRLPTEAEWEYAARGGNKTNNVKFSRTDSIINTVYFSANSYGKAHFNSEAKYSNELGIYNMLGNVWEWCYDWYENNYYFNSDYDNPQGPQIGKYKVLRGGSWASTIENCNYFYRNSLMPTSRGPSIGFRCAKDL